VTPHELLRSALRRWYAVIVVLAAAAALFHQLSSTGGSYSTRTVISFQLAGTSSLDRYDGRTDKNVIGFASAVATQVNNGRAPQSYGVNDAPLYGAGVRQGTLISVPNNGNQWIPMYNEADIEIQVVGRSYAWTYATQQSLVRKVLATAHQFQAKSTIKPDEQISVAVVPVTTQIGYVGASRSSTIAAGAGVLLAAIIVSLWAAVSLDRIGQIRARRRRSRILSPTRSLSIEGSNA
jgi:hypothetical protein